MHEVYCDVLMVSVCALPLRMCRSFDETKTVDQQPQFPEFRYLNTFLLGSLSVSCSDRHYSVLGVVYWFRARSWIGFRTWTYKLFHFYQHKQKNNKGVWEVEEQIHTYLSSALGGVTGPYHAPTTLLPKEKNPELVWM